MTFDELSTYLAAALAKIGEPVELTTVELTTAELDAGFNINLRPTKIGIRIHVTWDHDE